MKIEVLIQAIDRMSEPMRRIQDRIDALTAPARQAGAALDRMGQASGLGKVSAAIASVGGRARETAGAISDVATKLSLVGGAAALGGLALFKTQFLDTAASFERYMVTLRVVEGSQEGAKKAFDWVSDFATQTPYELPEVTKAFVDLRNLGLDPTKGSLQAAGDAAAIMGTSFNEAVTALSAGLRGEYDPLEQFGVFARVQGEQVVINWTSHGKKMVKAVDKNNREMIASTVTAIWNEKYKGGMSQLAQTWTGMMSNLADAWTRWTNMVMDAGVFDRLKSYLSDLLFRIDQLAKNGTLQRWAQKVADAMLQGLTAIEGFVTTLPERLASFQAKIASITDQLQPFADFVGGWPNLLALVAGAVVGGPIIAALVSLTAAFITLGSAVALSPFGLLITSLGLVSAAVLYLVSNWDSVYESTKRALGIGIQGGIAEADVKRAMGVRSGGSVRPRASLGGAEALGAASSGPGPVRVDTGGVLKISLDRNGNPEIIDARPANPSAKWQIDRGPALAY